VDLKNLSPKQEEALRQILSKCKYLDYMMRYDLSENVLRDIARQLADSYASLMK